MWRWIRIQIRRSWRSWSRPQRRNWNLSRMLSLINQSQRRFSYHQKIIEIKKCWTHQRPHHQKKRKICFRYRLRSLQLNPPSYWWSSWIPRSPLRRWRIFLTNEQTHQQNARFRRLTRICPPHGPNPCRLSLISHRIRRCLSWFRFIEQTLKLIR